MQVAIEVGRNRRNEAKMIQRRANTRAKKSLDSIDIYRTKKRAARKSACGAKTWIIPQYRDNRRQDRISHRLREGIQFLLRCIQPY